MWGYKNALEMPHDHEEPHRRRAHYDNPIALAVNQARRPLARAAEAVLELGR